MPSLHPSILFHFTSKKGLFGILEDDFRLSCARERVEADGQSVELGVPMISFCDLRLSELKDHMEKYGRYGIGLSKDWANRRGLNPVFYVNRHSKFTRDFIAAVQGVYRLLDGITDLDELTRAQSAYMDVLNAYRFMKNYEADLARPGHQPLTDYRFADEREWRYVPARSELEPGFLPPSLISTSIGKTIANGAIQLHRLRFDPDDIRYLVVPTDEERLDLIEHLGNVKARYDVDTRSRLASRILTAEQIHNDV